MGTVSILNSLAMIFIMIIPGMVLKRKHILDEHKTKGLTSIVVNLTWPCLVIDAMQISYTPAIFKNIVYVFIIVTSMFLIAFIVGKILGKILKINKNKNHLITFMLIFGNTGFIGIPVINALYGKTATFYASVVEMINDVFIFTIGIMLIQLSAERATKIKPKEFLSPGIFGAVLGFILFMTSTKLPGFLGDSISIIGAATTPISMIVIGSQLAEIKFKELISDKFVYITSFVRLIIIPIIATLFIWVILGDHSLIAKVVIIGFSMPVTACATIFTQQYDGDVVFATKSILLSTVICLATIPIFAVILQ